MVRTKIMAMAAFVGLLASPAMATSINLSTGVNGSNSPLAAGSSDPRWTISTDGGATFSAAEVAWPVDICCGMDTITGPAQWVTDPSTTSTSPATAWGVGPTVYLDTTFDLTGEDPSTASLSGVFRVADNSLGIYLNGALVPGTVASDTWAGDLPFLISSGFVSGINTLQIRGSSINSEFDGFYLKGSVAANPVPTPEPKTWILMATGALGLAFLSRKRLSATA